MNHCPRCRSDEIHRSRTKGRWEVWLKGITGKRPFRCSACRWRGWRTDDGSTYNKRNVELARRAMVPEAPNLTATVLARDLPNTQLRREALDLLEPLPDGQYRDRDPE